jgi:signal transduction histidine kinase/CheY-like chemotaxis protein
MMEETSAIKIEPSQTLDAMLHQVLNLALVAIGAEAGSLMLVANKQGILQIKARLGKPRPGRKTETVYPIDGNSVAAWVVRNKHSYLCSDVGEDENFALSRSGKNFLSLLSVPIVYRDKVVAIINADAETKGYFTRNHQRKMELVAEQVAPFIAKRISILDALAAVGIELTRLPRASGIEPVLERIAQAAVRSLGADLVTLYQYDQERDTFLVEGLGPTIAGKINDPSPMRRKVYPGDVPWTVVKQRQSGFYPGVQVVDFLKGKVDRPDDMPRPRFIEREGIQSMAALLLPFRAAELENEEVVGAMFVNYRAPHEFNIDERSALATFADYAAVAILNARREEQLRAEQEQRRVEQIKLVESISANFAHRMNNLAGISRVNAQLLREYFAPSDEYSRSLLDEIEGESKVLLELAGRLVRPFKETGSMLELASLDITKIIEAEIGRIKPDSKHIDITNDLARDLPQVQSVEFQLREVLHDMFGNALAAMKGQGSGRLMIRARLNEKAHRVEVEISDNGTGIRDDIRDKLFNPGVTTKKDSLGIGLWWCRTFMRATGGDVVLKDTWPGKGTTFAIEIPCANKERNTSEDALSVGREEKKNEVDILIVDDTPNWRNKLVNIVKPERYSVETAANYAEASRALMTSHFNLAIVDIRLEDSDPENKDGLRLLAEVDQAGLDTQVIMITGYWTEQYEQTARQSPRLVDFIKKGDIEVSKFRELVRRVLGRAKPLQSS